MLREEGYMQKGMNFYQLGPESNRLVSVKLSQWNTSPFSRFTLELGVYSPAVDAVMERHFAKMGRVPWSPTIFDCQLRRASDTSFKRSAISGGK